MSEDQPMTVYERAIDLIASHIFVGELRTMDPVTINDGDIKESHLAEAKRILDQSILDGDGVGEMFENWSDADKSELSKIYEGRLPPPSIR